MNTETVSSEEETCEYVYLLREREFVRLNEPVYKVGRTKQAPNERFNGYPKGSEIELYVRVNDSATIEKQIIQTFKRDFIHKKDYGNEYFEGTAKEMIKRILMYATQSSTSSVDDITELKDRAQQAEKRLKQLKGKIMSLLNETSAAPASKSNAPEVHREKEKVRKANPFFLFNKEHREKVGKDNPTFGAVQISNELGRLWKEMPAEEKQAYKLRCSEVQQA